MVPVQEFCGVGRPYERGFCITAFVVRTFNCTGRRRTWRSSNAGGPLHRSTRESWALPFMRPCCFTRSTKSRRSGIRFLGQVASSRVPFLAEDHFVDLVIDGRTKEIYSERNSRPFVARTRRRASHSSRTATMRNATEVWEASLSFQMGRNTPIQAGPRWNLSPKGTASLAFRLAWLFANDDDADRPRALPRCGGC